MTDQGDAPLPEGGGGSRSRLVGRVTRVAPRGGLRRAVAIIAGGQALAAILVALTYPSPPGSTRRRNSARSRRSCRCCRSS